jgi:hypothetical protein
LYSESFAVLPDDQELRDIRFEFDKRRLADAEAAEAAGDVRDAQKIRRIIGD